ncbi:histidine phosphatase family protein [Colwellia sp. PAMC 21821]|uniref:histidine phosphatase family protein n=1 Tax=Colwellia sp. PAMC 21821 TaxID=1816219 RepID=UPI0009BD4FFE|nr:histidine phosphatase family protein [Colwellia sp. PAMC 21821]ARD45309.1 hypothetical protein A3Q33_14010 [Colwellia sp. PAMC 21821]
MKTKLYLARHGQTQWNKVQRFQGLLDSELTETGIQQSQALARHLADQNIDLIISSSLGRAVASAKICQQQLNAPMLRADGLNERDLGHWQGQHVDDIKSDKNYHEILHQFTELKAENGESAVSCASRIYQTLEALAKSHSNKNLLVIFHGEALRCFLAKLGLSSTGNAYQLFDNGCMLNVNYQHNHQCFELLS